MILSGDFNIRDSEVTSLRSGLGLPANVIDVWESLGKRKESQYTWEFMRNSGLRVSVIELLSSLTLFSFPRDF